jgi:hypothetical protein
MCTRSLIRSLLAACIGTLALIPRAAAADEECPGNPLAGRTYFARFQELELGCSELELFDVLEPEGKRTTRVPYETVVEQGVTMLRVSGNEPEEWLALYNERMLYLYREEEGGPFFLGLSSDRRHLEAMYHSPEAFDTASFLTEGRIEYGPENLGGYRLSAPWVEGVPGPGIGEEITVTGSFHRFWISIGYVSLRRPELYRMNARPKVIRVIHPASGREKRVPLEDTPNPQAVVLDVPGNELLDLRIVIEEVYPGTRWEDTCINFITFF